MDTNTQKNNKNLKTQKNYKKNKITKNDHMEQRTLTLQK